MKNAEVFQDYDMVVSITEKTLNDQLTHLLRLGLIRDTFILVQEWDDPNYVYTVVENASDIPPDSSYVNGQILPQVKISESGTNITFILKFLGGKAYYWDGNGRHAKLVSHDMTGWQYGVIVDMDLAEVVRLDKEKGIKAPPNVLDQLHHFQNRMFTVNHLFMDFESTNLLRFDPAHTGVKDAGDIYEKQFVEFMNFYLTDLVKSGNPYILGYAITTGPDTKYDDKTKIPDDLKPVGTTYTMYHDPVNQALSNLNFVMVTKGGNGTKGISGSPGNFDTNWIGDKEQCDGKMIYSHSRLIEKFILQPFYKKLSSQIYDKIKGKVSVPQGNAYADGKRIGGIRATGYNYTISDIITGDDQYTNTFTADFASPPGKVRINLAGNMRIFVKKTKEMGVCQAEAHCTGLVAWTGTVDLVAAKDAKGNPTIKIDHSFDAGNPTPPRIVKNECAQTWKAIGDILGGILDALTLGLDGGFFTGMFDELLDTPIPGIGNIAPALGELGSSIGSAVMLPAGQVFYFKDVASDNEGNLNLELTYKSEN